MPQTASKQRQPVANKPQKSLDERVALLFTSLAAQLEGAHFRNALRNCDRILKLLPDDRDAAETKLYLLLQLEQYEQALELISAFPLDLTFERAYCLYRLHSRDEAFILLEQLRVAGTQQRGCEHLEAQLRYRDTAYDECLKLYTHLLDTCPEDGDESDDILNNLGAAQSYIDFINSGYQGAIHELNLDVSKLEASPPTIATTSMTAPSVSNPGKPSPPRLARKSRIPNHVVLGVTPLPDPERWLKKRDRTKDVRRAKKGKKEGMGAGATQGVAVGAAPTPSATGGTGAGKKKKKQGR
ncbi:hypothetical protein CALCODRAFT_464531 [Calocera cornea HHB12733]|uniref:Signal recognition particle subunit SRP72 n=1 Tax=Calocera cornea HHB12733 TaxID=1353952 RepID=A0A165IYY2_9BASI|nr:hypothetical protein CALCODRAFT_464531 [Calocera cornea HHB12733]